MINSMKILRMHAFKRELRKKNLLKKLVLLNPPIHYMKAGNREPNVQNIKKIADILGVSADELLGINDSVEATTLAAHFGGNEYTEEELDEIKAFAEFVKSKRK